MVSFSDFEAEVQSALLYLNDPTHSPGPTLARVLQIHRSSEVRAALLAAIESLQPDEAVPPAARARRLYELLRCRFVDELPQQECSKRLGLSLRHFRREQQSAIRLLAENLWPQEMDMTGEMPVMADPPVSTWRAQLRQEVSALYQHRPAESSNLAQVIDEAVTLYKQLGVHPHVQVIMEDVEEGATVAIHPSVLSQIIFIAIEKLASNEITRKVVVSGDSQQSWSRITIQSRPASPESLPSSDFITETVAVHGGRVAISHVGGWAKIDLLFAASEKSLVLVVDDNLDLAHFYERYVEGSRYEIVHVSQGSEVWHAVAKRMPDMIVLDVMLPDVNGWQLLNELRKDPATSQVPVIVCSVIDHAELARALGAAAYLAKPVHRQAFLQTLDQVRLSR